MAEIMTVHVVSMVMALVAKDQKVLSYDAQKALIFTENHSYYM